MTLAAFRTSWVFAWIALCAIAALALFATQVRADGGVPIPAPAGTTWSIVAGYNTATHAVYDGNDPHAIDLVRVPRAETAYTQVLSPVDGTVAWRSWDGLSIADAAGFNHLIVHVSPLDHIQRGSVVGVGEHIATVCPAYDCTNYGLPHVHYAIHESLGNGYNGPSIPFTGDYALEGADLPWSDEYNLHAGREFVSSNAPGWTSPTQTEPPPETGTEQPAPEEPTDEPTPFAIDVPVGGWRMVGVPAATTVAAHFASLEGRVEAIYLWHAGIQHFERYHPDAQSAGYVGQRRLAAGAAVWAEVGVGEAWVPAPTGAVSGVAVTLAAGRNLVSWHGAATPASLALSAIPHLSHAYRWNPYAQTYEVWAPGTPLDALWVLNSGDALWVVVDWPGTWVQ